MFDDFYETLWFGLQIVGFDTVMSTGHSVGKKITRSLVLRGEPLKSSVMEEHELVPIGSMYVCHINGNIYHQYTPNLSIYSIHTDPMGYGNLML